MTWHPSPEAIEAAKRTVVWDISPATAAHFIEVGAAELVAERDAANEVVEAARLVMRADLDSTMYASAWIRLDLTESLAHYDARRGTE